MSLSQLIKVLIIQSINVDNIGILPVNLLDILTSILESTGLIDDGPKALVQTFLLFCDLLHAHLFLQILVKPHFCSFRSLDQLFFLFRGDLLAKIVVIAQLLDDLGALIELEFGFEGAAKFLVLETVPLAVLDHLLDLGVCQSACVVDDCQFVGHVDTDAQVRLLFGRFTDIDDSRVVVVVGLDGTDDEIFDLLLTCWSIWRDLNFNDVLTLIDKHSLRKVLLDVARSLH